MDRYTLGVEKTFCWCGCNSIELRMSLAGYGDFDREYLGVTGGSAGNLSIILKRLIHRTCTTATVMGLAIDVPTGSDVRGLANFIDYTVHNEAVYLSPFAGMAWAPSNRVFHQVFVQVDVPTRGDAIDIYDNQEQLASHLGRLEGQTALYVDFQSGYWLYRNPCARGLTGLAALLEFHYTTTTTDADSLGYASPLGTTTINFGSPANRVDLTNLTFGLHAEIGRSATCRVGAVFPFAEDDDRTFDSEVVVQVEQRF